MKATEAKLLDFLRKSPQFVIPIYQRTYSWTDKECRQLWADIIKAGSDDSISVHFIGSVVYIDKADTNLTTWEPMLVIDGQQRLTTVTLLIGALAAALGDMEIMDGFSARKLRNYYLFNPEESGEKNYKLLLTQTDKLSLIAAISGGERPREESLRVTQNFALFQDLISSRGHDLAAVCKGLAKLMMVDIRLKRGEDNPQLIFESMNSTGRKLSQADLIRNYILMGLEPTLQTRLYEQYWRPMELDFGQEAYATHFDGFMRNYLTFKDRSGEIPRLEEVYEAFKAHAQSSPIAAAGVEALVKDIRTCARHFCAMALDAETDALLAQAFHDLRELKVDVAYPFLLELYSDFSPGHLSHADFVAAVRLIEAYVFRRAVCAVPTNSMNKTFAGFSKSLKKDRYLESIQAHFLLLPSYRRFPNDDEFLGAIQERDLYNFRIRSYWLRRLENHGRKERVSVDEYTIEHILPQNEQLSEAWRAALGPEWKAIQNKWLHTLGNLTLTGYNSEFSDRTFIEKRDHAEGGFKVSPLRLNAELGQLTGWNEKTIQARAVRIAQVAVKVWAGPALPTDILDAYMPQASLSASYSISDHPNLLNGPMKDLFTAFRREVLALDPCVTEEFLKLYVAYKAETNFVDVVPQTKRLRLSLNMRFAEISDPRRICKDVTSLGRWGNGDVEIALGSLEDLPYVMGLVRQALELQLGGSDS